MRSFAELVPTRPMVHVWSRESAFWMQTTGAALLGVQRCSLPCMRTTAQGGRTVYGLLYLAAVSVDWRDQEHRQGAVDADLSIGTSSLAEDLIDAPGFSDFAARDLSSITGSMSDIR